MENTQAAVGLEAGIGRKSAIARLTWIAGFAALTAIGAQIEIPHQPVPFTLQTFFVLLSGAILGPWNAAASQLIYLVAGAIGLPVFAGLSGGIAKLLGPTGGYLLSFPVAAAVSGALFRPRAGMIRALAAMSAGSLMVFAFGTIQLKVVFFHYWADAIASGFLIFTWWDALKIVAAAAIGVAIRKFSASRN